MTSGPPSAKSIFDQALDLASEPERAAYMEAACHGYPELRSKVDALLAAHARASGFLEEPALVHSAAMPAADSQEEIGGQIGPYKLLQRIGEGGMGTVYMAEQVEPVRRKVALKIIQAGLGSRQVMARFEAERQALALMEHPGIAKILDAGTTESGRPYFVMELVKGIPIVQYCDEHRLAVRQRLDLFVLVCQAVQHAHQKGVIHRDLKPGNILAVNYDETPAVKIIDFGVAKALDTALTERTMFTEFGQIIGTIEYMSPEQARLNQLDVDTRSDIYTLGVLLYELLSGEAPFDRQRLRAAAFDETLRIIREEEPPKPSTRLTSSPSLPAIAANRREEPRKLATSVAGDLDWIVMRAMEKDRKRRYETANELAADLKRHLNNEPVAARPPSTAYRFQKALRRHKLAFAAGAAVVLALLLGLGISLWQYAGKSRAERAQQVRAAEATEARQLAAQQRDLARERLCESLVREARSVRQARRIGYRREVLDLLKQAVALGTGTLETATVQREISACLGDWVGLDPVDIPDPSGSRTGALTADGALAAIASWNAKVSLRETASGREVALLETEGTPYSLVFDRSGRALFIALAVPTLTAEVRPAAVRVEKWGLRADGIWKLEWARPAAGFTQFVPTAGEPAALVLGPSDRYLAVMDAEMKTELVRAPIRSTQPWFPAAALSPDRRRLVFFNTDEANGIDVQLEVWDVVSNTSMATLHPHLGLGGRLSFGPDGRSLAASYENAVIVYDTSNFSSMLSMGGVFENSRGGTIGGSSGLLALPLVQELIVRLTQLQTGREEASLKLSGMLNDQCFSQDGAVLLLTHSGGSRIVHLKVELEKLRLDGHRGGVPVVEFSPDGKHLASAGKDRTLRLWDLSSPGEFTVLGTLPSAGQTLAYSPKGDLLVCGYYDTADLAIWSLETGKQVRMLKASAPSTDTTWTCAISADGQRLAAIGNGLRVWDLAGLTQPASAAAETPLIEEPDGYGGAVFDPAGKQIAYLARPRGIANSRSTLMLRGLNIADTPQVCATDNARYSIQVLTFLSNSGALAYVSRKREIVLLDPVTSQVIRRYPTLEAGETPRWCNLRASPDGSKLAMVTHSLLGVDVRDSATGKLLYRLPEEAGTIWWLAWSPDNRRLAVSRANGDISIWNLQEVETQVSQLGLTR